MSRRSLVAVAVLAALAALSASCSRNGGAAAPAGKPAVAIDVLRIEPGDQTDAVAVVGTLRPKFEALIKAEFQGVVEKIYVDQWVRVRKGDPLAKLDTREEAVVLQKARAGLAAAKAALLQAEARARQAEREAERSRQLKEGGLATQQSLDDAQTMREAAAAALAAADSQVRVAEEEVRHAETRLQKALITAPMDGVVAERNASPGDMVGEPGIVVGMFRIVDNRALNLTVTVPTDRLADLKVGQPLEFTVDAYPGRTFSGAVMFINPTVDEASRSIKVVAEVPNGDEQLRGGLFARGRIIVGVRSGVITAPRPALTTWDVERQTAAVFVVDGDVAHRREVRTGRAFDDSVEIASGLSAGEQVVVRGGFNLRDGDRVLISRAGE